MKPQHTILAELREIAPGLTEIGNQMPYHVAEGYFDGFPENLLENATIGLQNNIEPANFQVPDQYFKDLADQILLKSKSVDVAESVKVIPMRKMRIWVTYAAAAMFTGIVVTGSFMFSDKNQVNDFEKYQSLDISSALDQATESELNAYLETNQVMNTDDLPENEGAILQKTNEKIQNLSTENINNYLNEIGYLEPQTVVDPQN